MERAPYRYSQKTYANKTMNSKEIFRYEDGSLDTPDEQLEAVRSKIYEISDPITGQIYNVEGHRCLCIALNASYGGGMTNCWAVEGHSAQMTFSRTTQINNGYVRGKCLSILEVPRGIVFQPNINGGGWQNYGNQSFEKRLIILQDIGRYDINWV